MAEKISNIQKGVPEKEEVKQQMSEVMLKWHIEHPGIGKGSRQKQLAKRWLDPKQHAKMSQRMSGSNHPFWKGGISKEEYSEIFNADLKKAIKNRDGWKCVNCGISRHQKILVIHHIDENKLNNSINNLVTLCGSCHSKTHWKTRKLEVTKCQ
jgi:5-methylcytosine-specific restriction endonuclease McrA